MSNLILVTRYESQSICGYAYQSRVSVNAIFRALGGETGSIYLFRLLRSISVAVLEGDDRARWKRVLRVPEGIFFFIAT